MSLPQPGHTLRPVRSSSLFSFSLRAGIGLFVSAATTFSAFATIAPGAAEQPFHWVSFLAPFHAVVLHFPIGFLTMACVLELYRLAHPSSELKKVTALTLWLSLLSGLVAAALGVLRALGGGYDPHEVATHRWTGIAVVASTLLTLFIQRAAYRDETRRLVTFGYRGLLTVSLVLLIAAGHVGGNLTHGSKYLTENAPKFVRDLMEPENAAPTPGLSADGDAVAEMYLTQVQPIFDKKCVHCHGAEKQKGEYRLDDHAVALAGGESGKTAIKPGDPLASDLVRLILLPQEDDDVMPPKGKEALTSEEVLTVIRWIQKGAKFPKATAALNPAMTPAAEAAK